MKVALITSGQPTDTKGMISFVREKAKRLKLKEDEELHIDVYMVRTRLSWLMYVLFYIFKHFRNNPYTNDTSEQFENGGIVFNNIWHDVTFWSFFIDYKIRKNPFDKLFLEKCKSVLSEYDVLITHTLIAHTVGRHLKCTCNIPYIATWHGSDIETHPWKDNVIRRYTKAAMESANHNYYVSKALLRTSDRIVSGCNKDVYYTGPSSLFIKASVQKKDLLRKANNIKTDDIVIGFAGNLIPLKNPLVLPKIARLLEDGFSKRNFIFLVAGNGPLEKKLKDGFAKLKSKLIMLGKVKPQNMPDVMNCMDFLVLPSVKEGFGLVVLEARACGAFALGSKAGGIPESAGDNNTFSLEDNFEENIVRRISDIIKSGEKPPQIPENYSWDYAIDKEVKLIKELSLR